jgi:hypothetical protein
MLAYRHHSNKDKRKHGISKSLNCFTKAGRLQTDAKRNILLLHYKFMIYGRTGSDQAHKESFWDMENK